MIEHAERPLLDGYLAALARDDAPFAIPGHKRRASRLDADLGRVVDSDVPLFAGVDTMKLTDGRLTAAERLAADLWGADWCRFGTGGATQANQALLLALGQPGQPIVMARSIHRSVMSGLVLTGLDPVWLGVHVDAGTGLPVGPTAAQVSAVLDATPDAAGVWLTEPSYLGTVADIAAIAHVAHERGVPLVVDQAWAAHFGFHPALPPHALAAGADAMVVSAHKALPAYSQAALALASTSRIPRHRLETAFDATHTTSPAGAILASIDGARALLADRGPDLLGVLIDLVSAARARLSAECPGVSLPDPADFEPGRFDPTKLVVGLAGTGADGIAVESDLIAQGLPLEMADRDTLVAMVTVADDHETVDRLLAALGASIRARSGRARRTSAGVSWTVSPERVCTPREAFFAPSQPVAAVEAVGRVCAELIAIYPPGVPVLAPGERVTSDLLDALREQAAAGSRVAYAADPTLATLRVLT